MKKYFLLICALFSISVQATLIDLGDYTTDTVANRDWLDLSFTDNMSYESVLAETALGGTLEGWTIATHLDVYEFFDNAGGDGDYSDTNNASVFFTLYPLWGQMPYFNNTSWFYVEDLALNSSTSGKIVWANSSVEYSQGFTDFNEYNKNIGAALYRTSTVPEPSALAIFALGILGLASRRFKK